jgi:chorismate synthase
VIAGSFAQMCLKNLTPELNVVAFAKQIGPFQLDSVNLDPHLNTQKVDQFHARFPCKAQHEKVLKLLLEAKNIGDSYGGSIQLLMQNVPAGLGQPVMHKLKADLGAAILSIGAVSGVNFGQHHEHLTLSGQQFHALNQPYGGIQGGISTGDPIEITIYVKPTSSILDVAKKGRHDPCIIPRVIPVVESMTHLVLLDHLLWQRTDQL